MGKSDVVAAQKAAVLSGQDVALETGLEGCYDGGFTDGIASVAANPPGSFSQADIDAAVAKAQADDQVAMTAAVAQVQSALDAMTAKDNADIASLATVQAKLDQIKALLA